MNLKHILVDETKQWLMLCVAGKLPEAAVPEEWKDMVPDCTRKMRDQVQMELTASMTYLAMVSTAL